jgi:23S rRNA (guanosine2251-2'-O)-methyltransferase
MVKIKVPREGKRPRRRKNPRHSAPCSPREAASSQKTGRPAARKGGGDRWIYGYHAVTEALRNPDRRPERLLATASAAERLRRDCPESRPEIADRGEIDAQLPPGAVHQGVALLASPLPGQALEEVLPPPGETALILMLDQVTDPQNVGAILRSAAAFGARAVIVPRRHAPPVTGALAKAASGALEHVPLIEVGNLERALQTLKDAGFWCIGLDGAAKQSIDQPLPGDRLVLVMGAEGPGLRRLTAERCDLLVRLPTQGPIAALNVSNAAAVALYALTRQPAEQSDG